MSEPIDDKAFDEYLSGRSQISQRYRALHDDAHETVPPALDRRILAQARDAIGQAETTPVDDLAQLRTKRRRLMQWSVPAALAASAVLVISIVVRSGVQHEVRAVNVPPVAAPVAAAPPAPPPPSAVAKQQSTGASAQDGVVLIAPPQNAVTEFSPLAPPPAAVAKEAPSVRRMASPPAPAPLKEASKSSGQASASAEAAAAGANRAHVPSERAPTPVGSTEQRAVAAAPQVTSPIENSARYEPAAASPRAEREQDDLSAVAVTSATRQMSMASDGATSSAPAPGAVEKSPRSDEQPGSVELHGDPQRWLEHIRELRRNDKQAEADSDWKEFRARYPDYPVTETDVARSKSDSKP
ncbi:MAG TPA: hypothetical protein VNQ81_04845 [Povalibacter sp.]|nr:hypothetical protein [Povalibacter sp.]